MGNSITQTVWGRASMFLVLIITITVSVWFAFPYMKRVLSSYSIPYYNYTPTSADVLAAQPAVGEPAQGVPILMYHGVIEKGDEFNTSIQDFISQMEMLKKEGYTTISVHEFDLFRQGLFTLPAKPIIITFDDGRKDSFYTTDDILRKLGFKATLFVATGPNLEGNSFYLTWAELKRMQTTGRWELEAHGRHSHDKIKIFADNHAIGRFLSSKLYLEKEKRLETVEEFESRVEQDYINGIQDLHDHLGIDPHYFAIPLNDYGELPISNHEGAVEFNRKLIEKYFRLAFIQANDSDEVKNIYLPVYNFPEEDPYLVRRIEMKNMEADFLKATLDAQKPTESTLSLTSTTALQAYINSAFYSGMATSTPEGLVLLADKPDDIAQVVYGNVYWKKYKVAATVQRVEGRSVSLLFHFKDSNNYMSFGNTDKGFFLRSVVNGVTKSLVSPYIPATNYTGDMQLSVSVTDVSVTAAVNGKVIFKTLLVPLKNGVVGIRAWDDTLSAKVLIKSVVVSPL